MADPEWVHLTDAQLDADETLGDAIDGFQAPTTPAGEAAERWLKDLALAQMEHIATYVQVRGGEVAAFYSLGMGEAELRTSHRDKLGALHPRLGAVLILWLARARNGDRCGDRPQARGGRCADRGPQRRCGRDRTRPYGAATERFWRERFAFRASRTRRRDVNGEERPRLWLPLFPEG